MPSKFVQNTAERMGVSVEHAEKVWHDAKQAVKKGKRQGSWYWGKVVNTFKRMMGLKEATTFKELAESGLFEEKPDGVEMPRFIKLAGPYVAERDEDTDYRTSYRVKKLMSNDEVLLRISVWYGRSNDDTGGMWTFRPTVPVDNATRAQVNYAKVDMSQIGVTNAKALTAWARDHLQYLIDRGLVDQLTVAQDDHESR